MTSYEHRDVAHFEYTDEASQALAELIPDDTHRYYFLRDGVEERLRTEYRRYLSPFGDGAIATVDGYSDIPSMWLWFRLEPRVDGLTLVFTSADLAEGPLEEEDDS